MDFYTLRPDIIRWLERVLPQQLYAPLSYQSSVATILGARPGERDATFPSLPRTYQNILGSPSGIIKKVFGTKINWPHEAMVPTVLLRFLSHFLPTQLAQCYTDPSFFFLKLCYLQHSLLSFWSTAYSLAQVWVNFLGWVCSACTTISAVKLQSANSYCVWKASTKMFSILHWLLPLMSEF